MSAPPRPGVSSFRWFRLEGLGEVPNGASILQGWMEALLSSPGDLLVLEQWVAEEVPSLHVGGRPELLAVPREGTSGRTVRLRAEDDLPRLPRDPRAPPVFGRLVWEAGGPELAHAGPEPGRRPPSAPLSFGDESGEGSSAVQAFLRSSPGRQLWADVRVAGWGPGPHGSRARDRTGLGWGALLGASFERWGADTRAGALAFREWSDRRVVRFHSGNAAPPAVARLARPWRFPRALPEAAPAPPEEAGERASSPRGLHLGLPWDRGSPYALPLASLPRHVAIVGMTGSGKTQLLAHLAGEAARRSVPFVLFDLHGDLAPAALGRLPASERGRVLVIDATRSPAQGVVGVDVLRGTSRDGPEGGSLSPLERDRLASEVVGALRPLGGGKEELWGPRMERFLESGVRAVIEGGGTLHDVAELLQDPVHRAPGWLERVGTPVLRRFLEDLPALFRRQPDLLSSSQNRLSKLLLSGSVRALLAPEQAGVDLDVLLESDRSLLLHLPKGKMGESGALFVANLLLARLYVGMLRSEAPADGARPRRLLLLDEAQGFSPGLLRSLVEEGRKFGVACVMATQSPGRLEGFFARAPTDAVGTLIALRLPPEDAGRLAGAMGTLGDGPGPWSRTGGPLVPGEELRASLATLPAHAAWVWGETEGSPSLLSLPGVRPPVDRREWAAAADRSAELHAPPREDRDPSAREEGMKEVLLWVAAQERPVLPRTPPGEREDALLTRSRRVTQAVRSGWVELRVDQAGKASLRLSGSGEGRLGYVEDAGALRESAEHRRLIRATFEIFARRGCVMEIPEQGRIGPRVPDGFVPLFPRELRRSDLGLEELQRGLAAAQESWVARLGHGRPIHVEAEVTGADRRDRLLHDLRKARDAGAHLLWVVGSSERARRMRRVLREAQVGPEDATIWVLRSPPGPEQRYSAPAPALRGTLRKEDGELG